MTWVGILFFMFGAFLFVGSTVVKNNNQGAFALAGAVLMAASLRWGFV